MKSAHQPGIPDADALAERWRTPDNSADPLRVDELPSFHLSRVAAQMRRYFTQAVLSDTELSYAGWRVLGMLAALGPVSTPDMLRISSIDKGQLSRATEQLAQRGLLTQSPDPENGRRKILEVTASGRELNDRILAATRNWQVQLLESLPELERLALARALRHLEISVTSLLAGDSLSLNAVAAS